MSTLDRRIAPEVKPLSGIKMPPVNAVKLSNGVDFNVYSGGDCDVNRLSVIIDGGLAEDTPARMFSLMNSVSTEGADGFTAEEVAEILDYNGSWLTSTESVHHSARTFFSLNSRTENVLPVIEALISSPSFNERQVAVGREKSARAIELKSRKVKYQSSSLLDEMLFAPGSPLGCQAYADAVRNVTPDDLRNLYSKTFSPEKIHVYLAGKIPAWLESRIASYFESLESYAPGITLLPVEFAPVQPPHTRKLAVDGALQTAVEAGIPVIGRTHPDYDMLRIAVAVLGGYFGSRLMANIREDKGYTYGIGAALMGYRDCGQIRISTETANANVEPVIDEIRAEMKRMHDPSTFTAAELHKVRSFIESMLASQLDTPFTVMDYHIAHLTISTPDNYLANQMRALSAITPEGIAEISRRYIDPDKLYIAVAGGE